MPVELGAEAHLGVVDGEVDDAAAELEEQLARVAVALVLLDRVLDRLLGEAVLQLEGGDRQAVDEQAEVERELRLVAAVAELAGDAEAVGRVALDRRRRCPATACRRRGRVMRAVLDAVAQHVDHAALGDLALEPGEEAAARRAVAVERERLGERPAASPRGTPRAGRGRRVLAVVVVRVAEQPAGAAGDGSGGLGRDVLGREQVDVPGHRADDQVFEAALARVGGHTSTGFKASSTSAVVVRLKASAVVERLQLIGISSGSRAASRTSSLPVTTSAIRRVRYSAED